MDVDDAITRSPKRDDQDAHRNERCTAPHPALSFLLSVAGVAVAGLIAWAGWRLLA